ncbi:MAG: PepSY domain-containing protein [Methylocystis sp.]|uniref:PepSY domain-containing protein n=1 Tax=Methylocystis sp. TaxID=1911079 RepID=UPI003D0CACA7
MAQARAKMEASKLADPFQCMREAALRLQGEPLGARLCQLGEGLIYEISLLRKDGHIIKLLVDAFSGRPHSSSIGAGAISK